MTAGNPSHDAGADLHEFDHGHDSPSNRRSRRVREGAVKAAPFAFAAGVLATVCVISSIPAIGCSPAASSPVATAPTASVTQAAEVRSAIERLILKPLDPSITLTPAERAQLQALYQRNAYDALWLDSYGQPAQRAGEVIALVSAAADHGLDPADYDAVVLGRSAAALAASTASTEDLARFDVRTSAAVLRYFRHLHGGRIDPRAMGFRLQVLTDDRDDAAMVVAAIPGGEVAEIAAALTPPLGAYDALRARLPRYRTLAADPTLTALPRTAKPVHPGEAYAGVSALFRLLAALGDGPEDSRSPDPASRYEGALVEAVTRFQTRHGLTADGVIGAKTFEAMTMPLAWRVRQIELGLERLRWLPPDGGSRLVFVNVPMFHLWAWDSVPPVGMPAVSSDVIVGRALSTHTPVFVEDLREVIFRPYWNVPASILRSEILPEVRRDAWYLQKHDMEIVPSGGGPSVPATPENIARLGRGLDLRQRPGPRNSLGLVKFVFPNQDNVYMHDTPAQALFSRSRRDFSHGCVRVRDPLALAAWALTGRPEWTRDRIGAAMLGDQTVHVSVVRPTRVVLFYTTAFVWPEDGTLRFADDIYRQDGRLDRALRAGSAPE
jgi:L,D-transpeptidase YcbB